MLRKRGENTIEIFIDASLEAINVFSRDEGKKGAFFVVKNAAFGVIAPGKVFKNHIAF